jgi:hypothetical protein
MARCMHGLGASCMTKAGPDLACEDMGSMTPVSRDAGPLIQYCTDTISDCTCAFS